jgi:hypothetical protein
MKTLLTGHGVLFQGDRGIPRGSVCLDKHTLPKGQQTAYGVLCRVISGLAGSPVNAGVFLRGAAWSSNGCTGTDGSAGSAVRNALNRSGASSGAHVIWTDILSVIVAM